MMRTFDQLGVRVGLWLLGHCPRRFSALAVHIYTDDPAGAMVAYSGKGIVGYAGCVVRGPQWDLAVPSMGPGYQGKGIGKQPLKRSIVYARRKGDRIFSPCTYGYNPVSLAPYFSFGVVAKAAILTMGGDLSADQLLQGRQGKSVVIGWDRSRDQRRKGGT